MECKLAIQKNVLGRDTPIEVPEGQRERHELVKTIAKSWASPFRDLIYSEPQSLQLQEIKIECWVPVQGFQGSWNNMNGRATLLGDAKGTMPMFRGEACNHAIVDVKRYVDCHTAVFDTLSESQSSVKACFEYESEMIQRTQNAVWASVKACMDAHNHANINDGSPLVSARALAP